MPRHESKIRVSRLIANKVRLTGLLQMHVDHAEHAPDLVSIAIKARFEIFLWVIEDLWRHILVSKCEW